MSLTKGPLGDEMVRTKWAVNTVGKIGRKGVGRRAASLAHGAGGRVIPDAGAPATPRLRPKAVGAGGDPLPGWVWSPVEAFAHDRLA